MCGIAGFVGDGDLSDLAKMLSEMDYRGPDGHGMWTDETSLFIGHQRLAIIDIEDGHQPLESQDKKIILTFNGEIYNHKSLRKKLEVLGYIFQTDHSDTEVILHGYREWGIDVTSMMNGMWAFALLDRNLGQLWLSRDRFGKKPLYYCASNKGFAFSSELTSILKHRSVRADLDRTSLVKYFAHGYVPAPRSMVRSVHKLTAGHNLLYDLRDGSSRVHRYWALKLEPDYSLVGNEVEVSRLLVKKLFNAVDLRLQADVPVGVFLSGGIDSSAITALALSAKRGEKLSSFSIGFEETSFDESRYFNEVAEIFGTNHTEKILSSSDCLGLLDEIYDRLDEPLGDSSLVPSFLMCKTASAEVKVVLGGDGADELFAGYDPFKALRIARQYQKVMPKFFHKVLSSTVGTIPVSHRNMSLDFKMKKFLAGLGYDDSVRNPIWLGPLPPGHLDRLFGQSLEVEEIYTEAIESWNKPKTGIDVDNTLQFYTELYLQNDILCKMDRAGMLNSLEVRSPFLDIELVDLVRKIPSRLKFDGKETKKILKEALYPILPLDVLYRKKKGFGMPIGKWFREETLKINKTRLAGILDTGFVSKLEAEHLGNQADWRSFLWAFYSLERWLEKTGVS